MKFRWGWLLRLSAKIWNQFRYAQDFMFRLEGCGLQHLSHTKFSICGAIKLIQTVLLFGWCSCSHNVWKNEGIYVHEQSTNHISLKDRPKCYTKSPTAHVSADFYGRPTSKCSISKLSLTNFKFWHLMCMSCKPDIFKLGAVYTLYKCNYEFDSTWHWCLKGYTNSWFRT